MSAVRPLSPGPGAKSTQLKNQFLGWQCRIRQIAMRDNGGRPSSGMCPQVLTIDGQEWVDAIVVLLNRLDQYEDTTYFKFQVQKSNDPNVVRQKGLTLLQSTYYQKAREFSDTLTSVFYRDSSFAQNLINAGECLLRFSEFNQTYTLACSVDVAGDFEPCRDAAIWHNRIFNTQLPSDVIVVKFLPDWEKSTFNQ